MTSPNPSPGFEAGKSIIWKTAHHNLEYTGEIIFADSWRPEMGQEIVGDDLNFRIVMLTRHQKVPPEEIADRRIAVCLPVKAVKERKRSYEVGEALEEPLKEAAGLYAAGQVLTKDKLPIDTREVFSAANKEEQLQQICSVILANAYPKPILDTPAFPGPLCAEDVPKLFDGFFGRGDNPKAIAALESFAVALGLAAPKNPTKLAPENCSVFAIIEQRLEAKGGNISVAELYRDLSAYGLPRHLTALYLLCFVSCRPEVELQLRSKPEILLRSGEVVPGGRLTANLIPQIWWSSGLDKAFERLCYRKEPSWNEFLPYSRLVCPEAKPAVKPEEVRAQEALLLYRQRELNASLEQIESGLALLSAKVGELPRSVLRMLERLSGVCRSKDYLQLSALVEKAYASPNAFGEDISLFRRLEPLASIGGEILHVKSYLDEVQLGPDEQELEMDRVSILQQLSLDHLLPNLHLWASIKALFEWFRSRYQALYLAHHQRYHEELTSLGLALEEKKPEIEALARLNSIAELGPSLGAELMERYPQVLASVTPCPAADEKVSVEEEPTCAYCKLALAVEPPTKEVEQFLRQLRQALNEQQRRLSSEAVRHILAQSGEKRIDRFIKVVQASDLDSLVNVLDDELASFLRRLLGEAHVGIEWRLVLSELAAKFPYLEEGDIDAAANYFAEVLRQAFARAKQERPDKQIRLTLKE